MVLHDCELLDAEASKLTVSGTVPDVGLALRLALGTPVPHTVFPILVYSSPLVVCTLSNSPAPAPARMYVVPVITWAVPIVVPAALPSHIKGVPVAPVPGAAKLIGVARLSLKTIVPSLLKLAEIAGHLLVRSFVQTRVSSVPVAVGSRLPTTILGVAGALGENVSTAPKALCAFPLVS